jgi:hypothetical protein
MYSEARMSSPIPRSAWVDRVFTKLSKLDPSATMLELQQVAARSYEAERSESPEGWAENYHLSTYQADQRQWRREFWDRALEVEPRLSLRELWDLADFSWREYPTHRRSARVAANRALGVEIDCTVQICELAGTEGKCSG